MGIGSVRLSQARVGTAVTVRRVLGEPRFRGRVMAMGIMPGASLSVVAGDVAGALVLDLAGSRCVLDRGSSELIEVREGRPRS